MDSLLSSKLIGSSLLALLLLLVAYLTFSITNRIFKKQLLSYAIAIMVLFVLLVATLGTLINQEPNLQFALTDIFLSTKFVIELRVSILMVVTFFGTQFVIHTIRRAFTESPPFWVNVPIRRAYLKLSFWRVYDPILQVFAQPVYERNQNEYIRMSLKTWTEEKQIEAPITTFFADKYWDIKNATGDAELNKSAGAYDVSIVYPSAEREIVFYNTRAPDQETRFLSIEDHVDPDPFNAFLEQGDNLKALMAFCKTYSFVSDENKALLNVKNLSGNMERV